MDYKDLQKIQKESTEQVLPQQKKVLSAADKIRRKTSNLPDPTHPPMGWQDNKGYDHIFPWIHLPRLHPQNHGDTVIFNAPDKSANQLILGDNLEVLRTLSSESIDLIYIDPPFFSGRNYNVIWGDTNEVRSFYDIWEGGIDSYLVWLNARLWEMRRVLKKTGSIYVHCDWHASHYIKTEMDKIFGYGYEEGDIPADGFRREIIWSLGNRGGNIGHFPKNHEIIFFYTKYAKDYIFNAQKKGYSDKLLKTLKQDEEGKWYYSRGSRTGRRKLAQWEIESGIGKKTYVNPDDPDAGTKVNDLWDEENISGYAQGSEKIGYPTQKPETLLERIIKASSNEGDVVADFFCGGGTTLAVAQKLKRNFIGCDSSRVAISVTLDRLIKIGEEMSGVKSNLQKFQKASLKKDLFSKEAFQLKIQVEKIIERVPNIEVSYLGVYPVEKFVSIPQDDFIDFVLTCYGASKNTAQGVAHGFRPPSQSEPILIGPVNPKESISGKEVKAFFDEIKSRLEPNKLVSAKIIGWRFSRQVMKYIKILEDYIFKNNLPVKLEFIPLDSKEFRARVLLRYPDASDAEFFLRFSKAPVIGDIKVKKIKDLEYEFDAIDAFSTNEDGWLVNCQWDFDYQEGHFVADKDYILSREKLKDKKRGEIFKAILKANYKYEKSGEYIIACKVQDNLAGETVTSIKINI